MEFSLSPRLPLVKGKGFVQEEGRKNRIFNSNLTLASHVLFKTSLHTKSPAWQVVQSESRSGSAHAWASQAAFAAFPGPQRPLDLSSPPLSHIKFSISSAVACTPWCTYEAFGTNVDLTRLCHSSLNMGLLLFSLAITLFVTLSLTPRSFPLTLSQRCLNVCHVS